MFVQDNWKCFFSVFGVKLNYIYTHIQCVMLCIMCHVMPKIAPSPLPRVEPAQLKTLTELYNDGGLTKEKYDELTDPLLRKLGIK